MTKRKKPAPAPEPVETPVDEHVVSVGILDGGKARVHCSCGEIGIPLGDLVAKEDGKPPVVFATAIERATRAGEIHVDLARSRAGWTPGAE
jgi:hypothetical protein